MLVERVCAADVEMAQAPESKEVPCPYHFFCRPVIEPDAGASGEGTRAAIATDARLFCADVKQGEQKMIQLGAADAGFFQSASRETDRLVHRNRMEFSLPADPKAYPCSCKIPFSLAPSVSLRS